MPTRARKYNTMSMCQRLRSRTRILFIALLAALLSGCATSRVSSVWSDPSHTATRYHNLIVFGVTNNRKVRRAYEDNFVSRLADIGVHAHPGHDLVADASLSRIVRMTEAISKTGADAIIITHLVKDAPQEPPPSARLGRLPGHYHNLVPYFSQVYEDVCRPGYYKGAESLRLEVNLYDAKGERLVWSGRSEQLDPKSEQTTIRGVIGEVVGQMATDGYLPWAR
jgi:hypothetical protein